MKKMLHPAEIKKRAESVKGKQFKDDIDSLQYSIDCLLYELSNKKQELDDKIKDYKIFLGIEEKEDKNDNSVCES